LLKLGYEHPLTILIEENMKSAYQPIALPEPFEHWLQRNLKHQMKG
jgi:hypothetical protein